MKAIKFMAFLLMAGTALPMLTSCEEDEDGKFKNYSVVGFEEENFTNLIDSVQYGGKILYSGNDTHWTDVMTNLSGGTIGKSVFGDGWASGIAISNYVDTCITTHADFDHQLAVPVSNGSKNFGVVFDEASIYFADGKARQINSIDFCPTTYLLGVMENGNGIGKALTEEGDYFTVTLTANTGGSVSVDLARDGVVLNTWKRVNLSSLGKITSLTFTFEGSDTSEFNGETYLNTPLYVAIDNINVSTGL